MYIYIHLVWDAKCTRLIWNWLCSGWSLRILCHSNCIYLQIPSSNSINDIVCFKPHWGGSGIKHSLQLSLRRAAEETMRAAREGPLQNPWIREGVLTQKLFHDTSPNGKNRFHKFDLWHSFHLGVGKHWLGAGMMILQHKVPGSNIDDRFAFLSNAYQDFCRRNKIPRIVGKLHQHLFGSTLPEPEGTWSKAAVTSNLCLFLEDFFLWQTLQWSKGTNGYNFW